MEKELDITFQHIIKKHTVKGKYDFEELSNKVVAHAIIVEQVEKTINMKTTIILLFVMNILDVISTYFSLEIKGG